MIDSVLNALHFQPMYFIVEDAIIIFIVITFVVVCLEYYFAGVGGR